MDTHTTVKLGWIFVIAFRGLLYFSMELYFHCAIQGISYPFPWKNRIHTQSCVLPKQRTISFVLNGYHSRWVWNFPRNTFFACQGKNIEKNDIDCLQVIIRVRNYTQKYYPLTHWNVISFHLNGIFSNHSENFCATLRVYRRCWIYFRHRAFVFQVSKNFFIFTIVKKKYLDINYAWLLVCCADQDVLGNKNVPLETFPLKYFRLAKKRTIT